MTETGSLWRQTAPKIDVSDDLQSDIDCDVVVVGAGFTGLRSALELAEAGSEVVVLEARDIAYGASGRSGGQVNPMLPVARPDVLRAAVGPTYFDRLTEMSLSSADALFALVQKHGIDCDARQNGWIRADHCARAQKEAHAAAKEWNQFGAGFEFLGQQDVARLTGTQGYGSAVLSPRGGAVQPLSLTRGLAQAVQKAGGRIFRNAPVVGLKRAEGTWSVQVAGRVVRASQVILATNGYTDGLLSGLRGSVLPLRSIQIATEALEPAQIDAILPKGHTISDTRRLITYARREPGNQVVFGGIGYRRPMGGAGGFGWILADAPRIFPTLENVAWTYRWSGYVALTPDRVPHLHEPEPGLLAGLGYNGRGVAMSLEMGRVLAQRALGSPADALPFPVTPIRAYAFRTSQWLFAGLAMSWLRFRDLAEVRRG